MISFKLGDWVISTKYPKANPIKIQHQHAIDTGIFGTCTNTKGQANLLYSEECMPWQPKVSEWCWFWNDNNYLPNLRQFSSCLKTIDGTTIHLIKQDKSTGILMSHCGIEGYTHCEPFIGQLPTSLKDNT